MHFKIAIAIREGNHKKIHRTIFKQKKMKSIFARRILCYRYIIVALKVSIQGFFRADSGKEYEWKKKTEKKRVVYL